MLVTNRFVVDEDVAEAFTARAHAALAALAARPGYQRGQLVRALDDPVTGAWSPSGSRWAPTAAPSAGST
ncbi:hypothetical protein GCM10029963_63190 [Micromonospora andamanensis]